MKRSRCENTQRTPHVEQPGQDYLKLYVGNLAYDTTEADLRHAFAAFGDVRNVRVVYERDTGRSRGFGFVEMRDRTAGEAALQALNGHEFRGRDLRISETDG